MLTTSGNLSAASGVTQQGPVDAATVSANVARARCWCG